MKEIVLTGEGYWDLDCTPYENIEGQIMQKDSVSRVQCIKIGEKIFYKKLFDEDMEESDGKILWYNSVLLPFIFKQIHLNHARYFLAIEGENNYLVSPSFLKEGERLVLGDEILGKDFWKTQEDIGIDEELEKMEEYLHNKGASDEQIQEVKLEHLKQIFVVKFLGAKNFHPGNWGIIENQDGKVVRTCPFMDYESACVKYEKEEIDDDGWANCVKYGENGLDEFIKYYQNFPGFKEFVEEAYQNFNLYRALKDSYDETHCKIDTNCVYYYYNFFEQRMKCLRDILDSCKQKETKGEEEK